MAFKKKFPPAAIKGAMDAEDAAEKKLGKIPSAAEERREDGPPKKKPMGAHPGFQALVKSGVPAGALANAARNASPAAKKANPNLKKVK